MFARAHLRGDAVRHDAQGHGVPKSLQVDGGQARHVHEFPRNKVDVEAEERKRVRVLGIVLVQVLRGLSLCPRGCRLAKTFHPQRWRHLSRRGAHEFIDGRVQRETNVTQLFVGGMAHVVG
ncbi:hypothetical protein H257_00782 [Aphanomyces astaci]|uniref:Uncharacterized protein n=1 Tax=Aphanomyces astaci TaxID=112090 RepID=W4HC30_APHAT|nr:hypothetical protein H257_00782 [Aphanomyces astaci]ETV89545.1 hypothetical protein H257_00782 [Aphanomyces astaci]|eukprot:XP_009821945.1 hypothetical protein H257_00782 [Aphanomyces astaci]